MSSISPNVPPMSGMAPMATPEGAGEARVTRSGATVLDASQYASRGDEGPRVAASQLPAPQVPEGARAGAANALGALGANTVSTDIYAVMALFQEMAQEQRNAARELRHASLEAQVQ